MAPKRSTQFSSLPYEIYQHILSFGVSDTEVLKKKFSSGYEIQSSVQFVANFQSLNTKIACMPEMERYFDRFWWNVWEIWFGINPSLENKFSSLREEMIRKKVLKRKVLMAKYIKYHIWRAPKTDGISEIKVVMIGKGGVGKSSITVRFIQNVFIEEYDPTIEDVYRKQLIVDGIPEFFDILDTAGPEEYSAMRDQFMRTGESFVLVCNLQDENSLEEAESLVDQLIRIKDLEENNFPIIFALNKVDLLKESERELIIQKFKTHISSLIDRNRLTNTFTIETSAKTGENINRIYEECVRLKRYGTVDNLTLLKEVIEHDSEFIEICKKKRKMMKNSKNCSLM